LRARMTAAPQVQTAIKAKLRAIEAVAAPAICYTEYRIHARRFCGTTPTGRIALLDAYNH
jgi:hypothetical protein